MRDNPFLIGDTVIITPGTNREIPEELVRDQEYVVEFVVIDRVQINGRLYFASRFSLVADEHKDPILRESEIE